MVEEKKIKRIIEEIRNPKEPDKNCDHIWKQIGLWDGIDWSKWDRKKSAIENRQASWVGGPTAKCTKCRGVENFDWPEWNAIPKENKIELEPKKDDD